MSNMSSFYGGRTATPFTIVKRFDGISLAEDTYGKAYYAVVAKDTEPSGNQEYILNILDEENGKLIEGAVAIKNKDTSDSKTYYIIKKNGNNFKDYKWKLFNYTDEGITVNNKTYMLPMVKLEGMLQCFKEGAATTNEINYGEYAIIDTVTNLNQYSNPDNGKIFRRGFDTNNGMEGAEYIGRILGPQGYNTGIQVEHYGNIPSSDYIEKNSIKLNLEDLLSGKEHNTIQCISANYMDEDGNVLTTKIGFKFPYLVNSFTAIHRNPYDERGNIVDWSNGELIESINNDENRPFYKEWKISIPKGIKGDTLEVIRIQPTIIPQGTKIYNTLNNLKNNISSSTTTESIDIAPSEYKVSNDIKYIEKDSKFYKVEDCTNFKVFYTYRNYDTLETGIESAPIEVGDINSIIKTTLDSDGTLKIYYDNGEIETAQNKIRWINSISLDESTSKLNIKYNNTTDTIKQAINYVKEFYISTRQDYDNNNAISPNTLYVYYSDPELRGNVTLKNKTGWVKLGDVTPPASHLKLIKRFNNVEELNNNIPPEQLRDDEGNPLGYSAYATGVLIQGYIFLYDYLSKRWYNSDQTLGEVIDAGSIINISNKNITPSGMLNNSIWFGLDSIGGRE